ncbi:MAG: TonB-dependent receptor [Proteobacteria bacterium]|nr:TonB-dependent receptor [Pseudomonadota bacterium]
MRFTPTDSLVADLAYYRNEINQESRASFTRMGRDGISFFGFFNQNTLNCSRTTQPMLGFLGANNALWCGELTAELPPGSGSGEKLIRDPRSVGQQGINEILSAKAGWDISDTVKASYQFGRAKSRIRSGGQSIPDAINGSGNPMSLLNFSAGQVVFDSQPNGGLEADSHEIRLSYDPDSIFNASLGYFHYKSTDVYEAIGYTLAPLGSIPLRDLPNTDPNPDLFEDKTEALFAQVGLKLLDGRLKFNLEGRYSEDDKAVETVGIANTAASASFNAFTPRLTVDYTLSPGHLLYGSFAQGIKSGGFNSPILANTGRPIDPSQATYEEESNWTYEIGSKNTFLDGRLLANLAVYYIDWSDLQINTTAIGGGPQDPVQIDNIGGATTYGAEFEGVWVATDAIRMNLGLSYNNPTFDDGIIYIEAALDNWCDGTVCPVNADIGGNTLNRVPKLQANLGTQYSGNTAGGNNYFVRGDVTYQSKQYMELLNVGWVPARTLVNARAGFSGTDGAWEVSVWAKNLLDKKYVANSLFLGFSNGYVANLGDRRTYGMTAAFNFK